MAITLAPFNFVGPRHYCMTGSVIVILLGLLAFYYRGPSMYNIDLTGGTLVTIRLNESDPGVAKLSDAERISFAFPSQTVYLRQDSEWCMAPLDSDGRTGADTTLSSPTAPTGEQ